MNDITQYILLIFLVIYVGIMMYFLARAIQVVYTVGFAKWLVEKTVEVAK